MYKTLRNGHFSCVKVPVSHRAAELQVDQRSFPSVSYSKHHNLTRRHARSSTSRDGRLDF